MGGFAPPVCWAFPSPALSSALQPELLLERSKKNLVNSIGFILFYYCKTTTSYSSCLWHFINAIIESIEYLDEVFFSFFSINHVLFLLLYISQHPIFFFL